MSQIGALILNHLVRRRRSLISWGLPLGLMSGFIVAIYPSIETALAKAVQSYPTGLKEAFGIAQLSDVEHYLQAEMLSLIVPLALGYLAVRAIASGLAGAAEEGSLEVLLSAPLARWRLIAAGFTAAAVELATVLVLTAILTMLGSLISDAGLSAGHAAAGFAEVWPLALLFAGLGAIACGFSLRTAVVTGSVAGVLVTMYLIDLIGKLDPSISGIRYVSVFKYYGKAIDSGIDPVAFVGITAVAIATAAVGALLFERRDLAA